MNMQIGFSTYFNQTPKRIGALSPHPVPGYVIYSISVSVLCHIVSTRTHLHLVRLRMPSVAPTIKPNSNQSLNRRRVS